MSHDNKENAGFSAQCVGYYEWDGLPCRVRKDEEAPHVMHAEIYIPGKGYAPVNPVEIYFKGHALSEAHYKELMLSLTLKKRNAH